MNPNSLIVVADAARARLFCLEQTSAPRAPVALVELESLTHPEARIKESDRHSGSFPAGVRGGKVGSAHTLNDHREAHETEERRRFAKLISHAVARHVKEHSSNPVIVVATHAVHSFLSTELEQELPKDIFVRSELGELTEHGPAELLGELERRKLFQP
jgi:protein required for attachment to host cells